MKLWSTEKKTSVQQRTMNFRCERKHFRSRPRRRNEPSPTTDVTHYAYVILYDKGSQCKWIFNAETFYRVIRFTFRRVINSSWKTSNQRTTEHRSSFNVHPFFSSQDFEWITTVAVSLFHPTKIISKIVLFLLQIHTIRTFFPYRF